MFCTTGDSNTRPRGKGGASLDTKTKRAASPSCPSVTQIIYMVTFKLIEISTTKNFFPKILGGQLPPLAPMWLRLWRQTRRLPYSILVAPKTETFVSHQPPMKANPQPPKDLSCCCFKLTSNHTIQPQKHRDWCTPT